MDIKSIKGIAIVAVSDGSRLGSVSDALFDLEKRQVKAFIVGSGGLFGGSDRILDISDVKSIGTDAVMIDSRDQLIADRNDTRYQVFPDIGKATSLRVVSESGSLVGDLATLQFDPNTGSVTDIEVSQHGLFASFRSNMTVPTTSVLRFGQDVAVISDEYAAQATSEADQAKPDTSTRDTGLPSTS